VFTPHTGVPNTLGKIYVCSHYAVTVCLQIKLALMETLLDISSIEQKNLNEKHSNLLCWDLRCLFCKRYKKVTAFVLTRSRQALSPFRNRAVQLLRQKWRFIVFMNGLSNISYMQMLQTSHLYTHFHIGIFSLKTISLYGHLWFLYN
jgi:hypothetical protein